MVRTMGKTGSDKSKEVPEWGSIGYYPNFYKQTTSLRRGSPAYRFDEGTQDVLTGEFPLLVNTTPSQFQQPSLSSYSLVNKGNDMNFENNLNVSKTYNIPKKTLPLRIGSYINAAQASLPPKTLREEDQSCDDDLDDSDSVIESVIKAVLALAKGKSLRLLEGNVMGEAKNCYNNNTNSNNLNISIVVNLVNTEEGRVCSADKNYHVNSTSLPPKDDYTKDTRSKPKKKLISRRIIRDSINCVTPSESTTDPDMSSLINSNFILTEDKCNNHNVNSNKRNINVQVNFPQR